FAYGMRNEALAARNALSWAQARALADGAIHRTAFELLRPKVSPDVWTADGSVRVWDDAGSQIAVSAIDESGKIDLNTAPDALLAMPGATSSVVDTYLAQRRDALAAKMPPPAFPLAGAAGSAANLWRIRAEVTMPDGVTFVREAVVRPSSDRRRLLTMLEWQDGTGRSLKASVDEQRESMTNAPRTQ